MAAEKDLCMPWFQNRSPSPLSIWVSGNLVPTSSEVPSVLPSSSKYTSTDRSGTFFWFFNALRQDRVLSHRFWLLFRSFLQMPDGDQWRCQFIFGYGVVLLNFSKLIWTRCDGIWSYRVSDIFTVNVCERVLARAGVIIASRVLMQ